MENVEKIARDLKNIEIYNSKSNNCSAKFLKKWTAIK